MFHHRASEIPGLTSTADGTASFVGAHQKENENIHVRGGGGSGNGTSGGTGKGVSFQTPSNVKKLQVSNKSLTTGGVKTNNNNNGGVGTTTIRRRALGDISNKKSNVAQQSSSFVSSSQQRKSSGQSALKPKSGLSSRTNGTTLIPTLSSKKTSSSSTSTSSSIIPASSLSVKKVTVPSKLGQQFQKLQIHQEPQQPQQQLRMTAKSSSLLNNFGTSSKLAVRPKQLPTSSTMIRLQGTRGKMDNNTSKVKSSNAVDLSSESGPVPDIEYPAGRTWKQQLEFDLKDEDDVASTSTLDHLLRDDDDDSDDDDDHEETDGGRTMWHDWSESVWQNRQKKEQDRAERGEKEVQDQINRLLEEEKLGLESLYDDTMDRFNNMNMNDHDHSYIFKGDMESNLLAIDDDDWSLPASSECGQTIDEELLFEL
eukprot:CAMPEP_0113456650 /NCGR_PEP_ID=MMETSP0014_2-20120614/8997_1 /TAXON_ID=2857 /ORGANISM="Nitzschia sp." /LENGTH=424 /DNA_ID=CAMNT_0000348111 /DNA_START=267 /DNA_END=1541 /DNA_ORIENTATION=+ /assembly_acc=CAM_ASM_000159